MISHKHQCIFIHIPKCAGTSIETVFGHHDGYAGTGGQDHRTIRQIEQPLLTRNVFTSGENFYEAFRRVRNMRPSIHGKNPNNRITLSKEQYESYFKFTIVRNPWSRVYSWYRNVMRDEFQRKNNNIIGTPSLNKFLRRFKLKGCLRPQTYWIKGYNGAIPLDFIGYFEKLQDDFREVCTLMGIEDLVLPHKIKGAEKDYRDHYDDESIALIQDTYQEEIALFGYTFEGGDLIEEPLKRYSLQTN